VRLDVDISGKAFTNAAGKRSEVLRNIAFSLVQGEVAVFLGPSGCGKTTLVRILTGLDRDYQGRLSHPSPLRIGMVFQEPRLLPWRSVEDNVRLAAPDVDAARLSSLFEVLELSAHRAHFPGELSLGLARRVALARALAIEPDFLVLDEPLVSLDAALAARLRAQIATLLDGRPIMTMLVTHSLEDAVRLGDRVFLLSARPASILHVIPIAKPRSARSDADNRETRHDLARLCLTDG